MANLEHTALGSSQVHEPKHITTAGTGDAGKVITPDSSTAGVSELRLLKIDEIDTTANAEGNIYEADGSGALQVVVWPYGGCYVTTSAETTISASGTYVKAAGTTTVTNVSSNVDNGSANNRLRYTGTAARHFHIVMQASLSPASGTNQDLSVQLYKFDSSASSGSLLAHSTAVATVAGTDTYQLTSHADTLLDTNDYVEVWVANNSGTNNIELTNLYLFIMGMPT